ncbi:MAG TPA: AIM24 family protein [Acidobacteriota bacterium]|nr:AIM24 family protein [Acidobacteriota bacterium]
MKCANCGADLQPNLAFCTSCGAKSVPASTPSKCQKCGADLTPGLAFCTSCGAQVGAAAKPPAPPPVPPKPRKPEPVPEEKAVESRSYTCGWCGFSSSGTDLTCPACGATIDLEKVVSKSGWTELPQIKDMARIQFGHSTCQIEGTYAPVADMNLASGDGVYFAHHVLLWKDSEVNITTLPLKGGWKRLLAGMPLIMTQAHGPGHIAFSRDEPGEVIALPIAPKHIVEVREHIFMVATSNVTYDWINSNVWFTTRSGDERETHYPLGMFLDRFTVVDQPGLLLLHGAGNVFVRHLEQGEMILVKPTAFLFKDTTVHMQLHMERPAGTFSSWRAWGQRYMWLRLRGPGRVAVQSAYGHFHDPGYDMVDSSPLSQTQW